MVIKGEKLLPDKIYLGKHLPLPNVHEMSKEFLALSKLILGIPGYSQILLKGIGIKALSYKISEREFEVETLLKGIAIKALSYKIFEKSLKWVIFK